MTNIIIIEVGNNQEIIQDVIKLIAEKEECRCTQIQLKASEEKEVLSFPGLCIDLAQYIVRREDKQIAMSSYEFHALVYLAKQPGRVFTKEQIYDGVYGDEKIVNIDNAVYCLIRGIRKKLKNEYIQTVRGIGYKFIIPEE